MSSDAISSQNLRMTAGGWVQLLILGALWGGSFFFASVAVAEIHPLTLVLLRVGIAALALHVYLLARGPSFSLALPHMFAFFVLAVLNNVIPFSLIFYGQTELGAGLASVLYATTPIWTVIVANLTTSDEKLSWNKAAGVALGVIGTAIIIGPSLLEGIGGSLSAKLAIVGAALSYAFAAIFAKRFRRIPPSVVATAQLTCATVVMIPIVVFSVGLNGILSASAPVYVAVLALGLVSTAVGFILNFNIIATAGATNASLVTLIVPVGAILLGALFLGERLELLDFAGMAVIAFGLVMIDGRFLDRR